MATKKEWTEYFALINDREPSAEEVIKAIESGDISINANSNTKDGAFAEAELSEKTHKAYKNAKKQAGNYWVWIKPILGHPSEHANVTGTIFLWLTFAIASITGALSFSNVVRRSLNAAYQSYSAFSGNSQATMIRQSLDAFNMQLFFYAVVIFAILYLAALPGLLLVNRTVFSVKITVSKYLKWFVPLTFINIIGAILSFFVPIPSMSISTLSDTESIMRTLFNSFSILAVIAVIGVAILMIGQQFMVMEAHPNNQKIDALWLVLLQWIMSIIVILIELKIVITPLLETLTKSIGNF
ncbi:hypothetical protein [Leuconostoc citreum]|uniref:hypothetical protein n=1 Tax=Leuconostoc citreum TaxID=33964 RepID=UPI000C289DFF|nr:hypothetical protein [Leuconostoc citreum]